MPDQRPLSPFELICIQFGLPYNSFRGYLGVKGGPTSLYREGGVKLIPAVVLNGELGPFTETAVGNRANAVVYTSEGGRQVVTTSGLMDGTNLFFEFSDGKMAEASEYLSYLREKTKGVNVSPKLQF